MTYKTILAVMTKSTQMSQLDAAVQLARSNDAHLEVLCLGVDRSQSGYYFAGASAYVFQEAIDAAMADAQELENTIHDDLSQRGNLRWTVESSVAQAGGVGPLVAIRARYADLLVQDHPYGDAASNDAEAVTEAALFEGGCPVLVLPSADQPTWPPRRVIIAWNQSTEAMAAVRQAMPILKTADSVEITAIDPKSHGIERAEPGSALAQMLSRHDINTEIAIVSSHGALVSSVLNERAIETGADLIVMGAYGHSRFRQAILGGATRNMLEKARIPVLMAR